MSRLGVVIVLAALCVTGCATQLDGPRYANGNPAFDLFRFFDGDVQAWGIVQNKRGELLQRFEVQIRGTVDGDSLQLDETFDYALGDGVRFRQWSIDRLPDGSYRGSAGDILGEAQGTAYGNAFRWTYAMDLPVGERSVRVRFDDWIWALDGDRIVNRSYLQKFGVDVAEVTIFMQREG